ncbi:MAG: hypothetical protein R3C11_27790 [Planctomycetaceae bacterium]
MDTLLATEIAKLLSTNPDCVAVISDIRHFYPSVAWDVLQTKFEQRLDRVNDTVTRLKASRFFEGVRAVGGRGIPIGPDFSHLLGHVALEDVDATLFADFGERYLRTLMTSSWFVQLPKPWVLRVESLQL